MPMVDANGRVLGRFNLVDVMIAVVLLGLIPLAYGSYVLFKTPQPRLIKVEPARLAAAPAIRLKVFGEHLRPYMRVYLGKNQGVNFLFSDSTEAEAELRDVPPGVYDVVLYDQAEERHRLPGAVTVAPSELPDAQVAVVGTFGNLTPEQAKQVTAGLTIPGLGVVERVGRPVPQVTRVFVRPSTVEVAIPNVQMLPVVLRLGCYVRSSQGQPECIGGAVSLQPSTLMFLPTAIGTLPFQIDQVRGLQPLEPARVTVRFSGNPAVLSQIKKGDVDVGDVRNELAAGATVTDVAGADVRLTVPAQRGTTSWTYGMSPLRLGSDFLLRTAVYEVRGSVIAIDPLPTPGK
jgi:hypothetical protein